MACAVVLALGFGVAAKAQTLTHRYSFNDPAGSRTFADSVGGADWAGTLEDSQDNFSGTAYLDGTNLDLDGQGSFAELPAGIITGYSQVTVEFWLSANPLITNWTRVFSFGDQTDTGTKNTGIDYAPLAPGNYQNLDYASNTVDVFAHNTPGVEGLTNVHVTVVADPINNALYYYNGYSVVSTQSGTMFSLADVNDAYNLIGRSLFNIDPTYWGSITEFRIYQGVVPASQIALNDVSGPDNYITNPGTITSLTFSSPSSAVVVNQSVAESLFGNFSLVSNLNLVVYGGVSYTSGNTNILSVNSNGVVKGVGPGSTTVVAQYGTLSATNTFSVSALPTTMLHRYSFTSDASDSIGGANGTLEGDATVSGGQLVLDGTTGYLSLPGNLINISTNASVTFEAWATIGETAEWSHLFEFGDLKGSNVYCAPRADDAGFDEFGLSEGFSGGQTLSWAHGWSNLTLHYVGVIDPTTSSMSVYTNGILMQATYNDSAPLFNIGTNNATLGQSSYGDPNATVSIDEFRIYTGALTPAQVAMSDQSGPNSTNFNPGALTGITVVPTNYPAYGVTIAPVVWASYANLAQFNLLPNAMATEPGLVVTSSNPSVISVNSQNMLTTYGPGTVTLMATYEGKTSSATVQVGNTAVLTHRYSFTSDASDSVGGANGTLVGTANVANGMLQLDGGSGDYVSLPPGLLGTYKSATLDIWASISTSQGPWSRIWGFADIAGSTIVHEFYLSPSWNNPPSAAFVSFGPPTDGGNLGPQAPPLEGNNLHLTVVLGDGELELYTNGIPFITNLNVIAPADQAGTADNWIGYSPYGDAGITGTIDEYRIYNGRLTPGEIMASDLLGPDVTLATNAMLSIMESNRTVTLSWPLADAGFVLQTTGSLNSGTTWTTVTNSPMLTNSTWQLTFPISATNQFFRLVP